MKITDTDREAAAKHGLWLLDDERDDLVQAFARHRLAAIEQAAKIADRHDTGDCTREDMEARRIAEEIRQLGEEA